MIGEGDRRWVRRVVGKDGIVYLHVGPTSNAIHCSQIHKVVSSHVGPSLWPLWATSIKDALINHSLQSRSPKLLLTVGESDTKEK